ncbi:uncharacterized protein LOC133032058 [Cannabis sativa]|uniref:uncharacterized protein LOC133032058 n=1 Tax=Cannabis sativa TaxID=3483 RepID=UPI0029C9E30D|nr:uncharacterized protein LOC133032058 [Cannabis sativa]
MASSSGVNKDMEQKWKNICLDDEEDNEVVYEEEDVEELEFDDRWCFVGRLLTGKVSDFMIFQNIMADLWKPGKGMYVKIIEQNRFLFQFFHEIDIQRVLTGSPWTYDRKQLIIERLKKGDNPRTIALNKLDIWVQIHDLQSGFKTARAVQQAGNYMGVYLESDPKNFQGVWREYLRVRVRLTVDVPLKRRMKFRKKKVVSRFMLTSSMNIYQHFVLFAV